MKTINSHFSWIYWNLREYSSNISPPITIHLGHWRLNWSFIVTYLSVVRSRHAMKYEPHAPLQMSRIGCWRSLQVLNLRLTRMQIASISNFSRTVLHGLTLCIIRPSLSTRYIILTYSRGCRINQFWNIHSMMLG